jgi:hypothetical protein
VREPIGPTRRKRLTLAERNLLLIRQGFRCGCGCGGTLIEAAVIDEHLIPLELSGTNDLKNRALYLVDCAKKKTRKDRKAIAHVHRLLKKADPATRKKTRRPIKSRGFDRSLRKKLDGSVVRR